MFNQIIKPSYWISFALLGFTAAAFGQEPINQARANAGNVTPGDAPGFPVTISRQGSFILTSNLTVPRNVTAIEVTNENVSIDLNGFVIRGPTVCSGFATELKCSPSGTGVGIDARGRGTSVSNGAVQGMGTGLFLGENSRVERVTVRHSSIRGMVIGTESIVSGCISSNNRIDGFFINGGTVTNNLAVGNGQNGIVMQGAGAVLANSTSFNGARGLAMTTPRIGYGNNVLTGNRGGDVDGGRQMGANLCTGVLCLESP